jgi:hypothetical protein
MIIKFVLFIALMAAIGQIYKRRTGHLPEWKYFKPYSVTWWIAAAPGVAGIIIAGEPLHGWHELAVTLANTTGGADPSLLIYGSAGGIGLTGRAGK